jgi:hypothetical protein
MAEKDSLGSIEERLALLEDRTKPKKKTALDHVKDWAGVATAMIALLYTIPLGVWDYWIKTPEARGAEALRAGLVQLAELEARGVQGMSSIKEDQLRLVFVSAIGAQRSAVLARIYPHITTRSEILSVPELIMLGYNLGQAGHSDQALAAYRIASEVGERDKVPISLRADVYRMVAQFHAGNFERANIGEIRKNFQRNLELLLTYETPFARQQAANSAFEWAFFEKVISGGDWLCGEALQAWARNVIEPLVPLFPMAASILSNYENRFLQLQYDASIHRRDGCPPSVKFGRQ